MPESTEILIEFIRLYDEGVRPVEVLGNEAERFAALVQRARHLVVDEIAYRTYLKDADFGR